MQMQHRTPSGNPSSSTWCGPISQLDTTLLLSSLGLIGSLSLSALVLPLSRTYLGPHVLDDVAVKALSAARICIVAISSSSSAPAWMLVGTCIRRTFIASAAGTKIVINAKKLRNCIFNKVFGFVLLILT